MSPIDYDVVYRSPTTELERAITDVQGEIPAELDGTVIRNGAGLQKIGSDSFNFFDAPGMVLGVTFEQGKARVRGRHVRHPFVGEELAAGRQLKRRVFTNLPNRWSNLFNVKIADVAQHDVYSWGGRLIASGAMRHCELDPTTLDSRAEVDWGVVPKDHQMCQMPRVDPHEKVLIGFSQKPGAGADEIAFWEFDERWQARRAATRKLGGPAAFVHDLAFSERYFVFVENGTKLELLSALWGKRSIYHSLAWPKDKRPKLWLLPRNEGAGEAMSFELPEPAVTIFHILNAHERNGEVIVDLHAFSGPIDFIAGYPPELRSRQGMRIERGPGGSVMRFTVDPTKRSLEAKTLYSGIGELPEIHPMRQGRDYRFAWLTSQESDGGEPDPNATLWTHGVCKLDVQSGARSVWSAGASGFVSQAVLAPRPGATEEDDGWLLVFVLDGERATTDLVILDASNPAKGELARLHLGQTIGVPGTHATFFGGMKLA